MKKIILMFALLFLFSFNSYAERETITTMAYDTSQLVKRGEAKVYSVSFVATANGGNFTVVDSLTGAATLTTIKAEGSEATAANGSFQDFKDRPLEVSTGLYLIITNGYVVLRYE